MAVHMIRNINVLEISYVSEVMSEGFVIIVTTGVCRLIKSRIGGNILVSFEELTMQFNGKTNKVGGHKKEITESE